MVSANTWYIYSPADTDEGGSRLMLNWGLGYGDALRLAGLHSRMTGRRTSVADEWFDTYHLGPELARYGIEPVLHGRSADPFTGQPEYGHGRRTLWADAAQRALRAWS